MSVHGEFITLCVRTSTFPAGREEKEIRALWDVATGSCVQVIGDPDHPDTLFWGLAWSPDGKRLAGATLSRGVLVWEETPGAGRWIGQEPPISIRRVAWSPDSTRLVGGAAQQAGRPELIRSPKRVLAHSWEAL